MADQYRINRRECGRNGKCRQREMENHYLLTQMANIIMQIYLAWNPLRKEIKQSIKNTSSRFLESFRRQAITDEDVFYIQDTQPCILVRVLKMQQISLVLQNVQSCRSLLP